MNTQPTTATTLISIKLNEKELLTKLNTRISGKSGIHNENFSQIKQNKFYVKKGVEITMYCHNKNFGYVIWNYYRLCVIHSYSSHNSYSWWGDFSKVVFFNRLISYIVMYK